MYRGELVGRALPRAMDAVLGAVRHHWNEVVPWSEGDMQVVGGGGQRLAVEGAARQLAVLNGEVGAVRIQGERKRVAELLLQ